MTEKISAILVDDETDSREILNNLLRSYFPEIELLGEASNVEDAYKLVMKVKPQLVFLDIQMPRANGFNLLKKFEVVPFEVIFVTSYDQYAINAIKFNALDYILKPVEIEDMQETIKKAVDKIERKTDNALPIINLLYSLDDATQDKRITVHAGEKVKILNAADILYIEADGRYCKIFTSNNEQYTVAKVLKDFEDYFGDHSSFIRVNKSVLVNAKCIKGYSKGDPFEIEMLNGKYFEVSRRRKPEILEKLQAGR